MSFIIIHRSQGRQCMNEIDLIRSQLLEERARAIEVTQACAQALGNAEGATLASGSPLEEFRRACVDYLVCTLAAFEERDQRLAQLTRTQLAADDPGRRALEDVLNRRGRSREALEHLEAAFSANATPQQSWQEFVQYFNATWRPRREALDSLLAGNARVADWRTIGGIDADNILEERRRYRRLTEHLPAGIRLAPAPAPLT
jgi:tetratricopeptide (TPR) repeat protein